MDIWEVRIHFNNNRIGDKIRFGIIPRGSGFEHREYIGFYGEEVKQWYRDNYNHISSVVKNQYYGSEDVLAFGINYEPDLKQQKELFIFMLDEVIKINDSRLWNNTTSYGKEKDKEVLDYLKTFKLKILVTECKDYINADFMQNQYSTFEAIEESFRQCPNGRLSELKRNYE